MLIYDNGRVCVLANTRCGHTSMRHYFGLAPDVGSCDIRDWYNTTSHRVMVLRNPLDRLLSAQALAQHHTPENITETEWLARHSAPYLYSLAVSWNTWSYIPFEHLNLYIPYGPENYITHSSAGPDTPVPSSLRDELAAYKLIKRIMPVLTPEQWRELTG